LSSKAWHGLAQAEQGTDAVRPRGRQDWVTAFSVALLAMLAVAVIAASLDRAGHRNFAAAASTPPAGAGPAAQGLPAPKALARRIAALGQRFDGRVGIAVRSVEQGWTASFGGEDMFPQQSISKLWVAAATLDLADEGKLRLADPVTVTSRDLTLFHQPIRKEIGFAGFRTDLADLMRRAIAESDNTANDVLFRRAGGQDGVTAFLSRNGLGKIAIGPGEKLLQTRAAGMAWDDSYSRGRIFWTEREKVPIPVRARALGDYVTNPPDGASPHALTQALARLKRGELLSPASTRHLLDLMDQSTTGPERLRGGLAEGWTLAHKTGTGQVMGDFATAYNDSGVLTSPAGKHYAIAVLIASTHRPVPERQALMQEVTRAAIACEASGEGC
jgi:beta-lactamase class A